MKIIDILNKIANNEEVPKKIKVEEIAFDFDKVSRRYFNANFNSIGWQFTLDTMLNDEVEIIEDIPVEGKIKHIKLCKYDSINHLEVKNKINEIIDRLNEENKYE